jgi:hypothetical protein
VPKTNIQIIDPTKHKDWDELLLTNKDTSFFHTSGWAKGLAESYGYKPLYFTQIDNGNLTGLIATMEVNSFLTGKRGVSLPFTDQCEPIAKDQDSFKLLFDEVVKYGKTSGWKGLEIRGGKRYFSIRIPSDSFNTYILDIAHSETSTLSSFRDSTRRNINKAQKTELVVTPSQSMDAVQEFCRLNALTRRDHGLPPQPVSFFRQFHKHIISKDKGLVVLAKTGSGDCIAGAIFSSFNSQVIFKYGASDKKYHHLRPNNLVMWEAIKAYSKNGAKTFDFGRTELDHKGLMQFKRGWGTKEGQIHYYHYDIPNHYFIKKYPKIKSSYFIFNKMPIPLLKLVGRVLYRHIA